jgi:ribosome-associated protein
VEIRINIRLSASLTEAEKELIFVVLKNRINSDGELVVRSRSERTQLANKKKARERLLLLISECLAEKAERKPTEPTRKSRAERIDSKKKRGRLKELRSDRLQDVED